jgi:hypothetical protein
MSWLTPEILASFPRPATLAVEPASEAAHRASLESQVDGLPAAIRDEIVASLADPERGLWGRTALAAVALARTADLRPTSVLAPGVIGLEDPLGRGVGVVPMALPTNAHPAGAPADLARLVAALDATFGDRQYVLYLRKSVPPELELGPITRAVHLWLSAIQRGEWQGQHAIYEDQHVALELTVTGTLREDRGSGLLFTVGPVTALEQLASLDQVVMEQISGLDPELGEIPLVAALGSGNPWKLPRGYVQQLLLGTPDQVRTNGNVEPSYEAIFRQNSRSMFADPVARTLCAVWWIGPPHAGTNTFFSASSWDNPWSNRVAPAVGCPRFRVVSSSAADGTRRSVMTWTGRPGEAP